MAPLGFDIESLVVTHSHASGRDTVQPMADLSLRAHGVEARAELRLYLESFLRRASAETRARFSSERGVVLRITDVLLSHSQTPKRFRTDLPLAIPSLVLELEKGRWVVVIPLEHTFWVDAEEDLDEAIRDEVRRMVRARRDDPWDFLALLPAVETTLSWLRIPTGSAASAALEVARKRHREVELAQKKKAALRTLESVATPWHELQVEAPSPPQHGRHREHASLAMLLEASERGSVLLVGAELVGKTALFETWFADAYARNAARPIYQTSAARLIAGMSGLGQWQARMERVLQAAETLDAILYFEHLVELFGDRSDSSVDLVGAIKPFLEGRVRLVAEVTPDALRVLEPRHAGFFGALTYLRLDPLDADASRAALALRRRHHRDHQPDRPQVDDAACTAIVELVDRYLPYQPHPGKAVRLYDELRAAHEKDPSLVGMASQLGPGDAERIFSVRTGIPTMLLSQGRALSTHVTEAALRKRVIGQGEAVRQLAETIAVLKAGLAPSDKPLGVYLFVGPTGVGKTELARALAGFVFGSESRMVRFDMSEYADAHASLRLIRGTDRHDGLLTQAVRRQPFSILLLDEIEKAHPAVFDLLLGALGEARISNARGQVAYLHNTLVVMTSNVGSQSQRRPIGIGAERRAELDRYLNAAQQHFRPEFLNRLDRIIPFAELTPQEIQAIAELQLGHLDTRRGLTELSASIAVDAPAVAELARRGYSKEFGARQLRRTIEDDVVVPAAELLAEHGKAARAGQLQCSLDTETGTKAELAFRFVAGGERTGGPTGGAYRRIATMRRAVDTWFFLSAVVELRERVDFLVAQMNQLSRAKTKKQQRRAAIQLPEFQKDHHRLSELNERLSDSLNELCEVEELALTAHLAGEDGTELTEEAEACYRRFRADLPYALLTMAPARDAATLICQEPDPHGAFERWLLPLLRRAPAIGWQTFVHIPATFRQPGLDEWPDHRFWGPSQSAAWIEEELTRRGRSVRDVLLRVKGPYAGVLVALEAGLHRWASSPRSDAAHLVVTLARMADAQDQDHENPLLRPLALAQRSILKRRPTIRSHHAEGELSLFDGAVKLPGRSGGAVYWQDFPEIALEHLLHLLGTQKTPEDAYAPRLEASHAPGEEPE
ncbi:MAG: AAA family ATPase [Myxococcota bacterium]